MWRELSPVSLAADADDTDECSQHHQPAAGGYQRLDADRVAAVGVAHLEAGTVGLAQRIGRIVVDTADLCPAGCRAERDRRQR